MKYYWVKNNETGVNEIIQESELLRLSETEYGTVFNRMMDETNYSLENIKEYYTFICEVEQPNGI